jgi:uncharacterized protein (DUF433 family)
VAHARGDDIIAGNVARMGGYNGKMPLTTEEGLMDTAIPGFRYLVTNPERLGGKPTIKGTRFSVSFVLACLADGMSYDDIVREYSEFPRDSLAETLRFAAEVTDRSAVAA